LSPPGLGVCGEGTSPPRSPSPEGEGEERHSCLDLSSRYGLEPGSSALPCETLERTGAIWAIRELHERRTRKNPLPGIGNGFLVVFYVSSCLEEVPRGRRNAMAGSSRRQPNCTGGYTGCTRAHFCPGFQIHASNVTVEGFVLGLHVSHPPWGQSRVILYRSQPCVELEA
jgi:hypothetical protein